ncbi:ATP-binding protein [Sorangium sp. So ce233]|uniref:ATP-binding protein n=1 Tax=Sorangium sp. So ce233 TaxID=3133290 RepID=UPI003F62CDA3
MKLADHGLASRRSREQPAAGPPRLIEGSLPYLSPEQTGRMNRAIDSRADVYALGVTFYRMLTGRLPFEARDPLEWVHCHVALAPPPPSSVVPELPEVLSAIVLKLLAKMAEDRYQTARGLKHDLERCLSQHRDHGRIEPFSPGERDVSGRVRDVVARFELDLARAGCSVSLRTSGRIVGCWDRSRLDQIVTNLLANAIKFGAGKPIEIFLGEEAGTARLSVRDHGIGIDPARQERIFDRFERAVSERHYGGLGLGLYISRQLAQAHGGSIRVQRRPAPAPRSPSSSPAPGRRRRRARRSARATRRVPGQPLAPADRVVPRFRRVHLAELGVFSGARSSEVMLDVVLLGPAQQACRAYLSAPGVVDPAWMRATLPDLACAALARVEPAGRGARAARAGNGAEAVEPPKKPGGRSKSKPARG